MDLFFRSVREAFVPPPGAVWWLLAALFVAIGLAIFASTSTRLRRWRLQRLELTKLARRCDLSPRGLAYLTRLAERIGAPTIQIATSIGLFERATAHALRETPTSKPGEETELSRNIRSLRWKLGFADPSKHVPLLTTRELVPGALVEISDTQATIADAGEAFLVLRTSHALNLRPGQNVRMSLTRSNDARYEIVSSVLATRRTGTEYEVVVSHDESPVRMQLREHFRVPTQRSVILRTLWPRDTSLPSTAKDPAVLGVLRDVSIGGMALEAKTPVPIGSHVWASFNLDHDLFHDLPGTVIDCAARGKEHTCKLRVRFDDTVPLLTERRLAAAITHQSARAVF